jgi:hypothetical protein
MKTELINTKRQHFQLRLTSRFAFYDEHGTHLWREWPEGAIVSDPAEIETLMARKAPVERIEMKPETSPSK